MMAKEFAKCPPLHRFCASWTGKSSPKIGWELSTAENQVQFEVYLTYLEWKQNRWCRDASRRVYVTSALVGRMGKERKINGFNLRGVTSAKLSGSSVGIPGSISGNFPHTMTQKLKLRRYGTSWSLTSMRQMISASCTLQYKFYSENMATDFPRREVKVILKDGTDDCPFLPKRNTKTVIIYLHSFHHPISNLRDYRGPKKASAAMIQKGKYFLAKCHKGCL